MKNLHQENVKDDRFLPQVCVLEHLKVIHQHVYTLYQPDTGSLILPGFDSEA